MLPEGYPDLYHSRLGIGVHGERWATGSSKGEGAQTFKNVVSPTVFLLFSHYLISLLLARGLLLESICVVRVWYVCEVVCEMCAGRVMQVSSGVCLIFACVVSMCVWYV